MANGPATFTRKEKYAYGASFVGALFTANPLALLGPAIKKWGTPKDASTARKWGFGFLSLLVGGPGGLLGYLLAEPSKAAREAAHSARADVVADRYV